jgi:hypothetical protein
LKIWTNLAWQWRSSWVENRRRTRCDTTEEDKKAEFERAELLDADCAEEERQDTYLEVDSIDRVMYSWLDL